MDSSRTSHLLLAYCNSLQGFHSHHWGCENSALCLIHSHWKGCRRHSSHPRLPWFVATSVRVTAKMRADVQLHLPASFHSPKSPARNERGEVECTFLSPVFCLVMFCKMGERYCVAMLIHELLTAAVSPGPSHYRLAMEKEPASHSANSNTASTSPSQLPDIQKRLTHTNTHTSFKSTDYMHACMHLLTCIWVCIGI